MIRIPLKLLTWGIAALCAPVLLYAGAVLVLGLIPCNRDFRPADNGIDIYISSNGVHADLLLPQQSVVLDWRSILPASDFNRPDPAASYLAIGWGDRDFYLNTPTWAELKLSTAVYALSGRDSSLLHVEPVRPPLPSPTLRHLRLSPQQLRLLDAYILRSFALDAGGHPQRIAGAHYYAHDAFYQAHGAYSLLNTCNEWARSGLAEAGVRSPLWSPLTFGIFHQLPDPGH
jgi:uncharacterized protein (TIGR02117 family)